MEVMVLASGSSGNATLIRAGGVTLLVDAGVSALQVRRRMEVFGLDEAGLDAVLVTHEHSDHVRGLDVMCRRRRLPVWATAGTWSAMQLRSDGGGELRSGRTLRLDGLEITPVATSHDAAEPVALVLDDGSHRVAVCTDTGVLTPLLAQRLAGVDLLLLETNHDADMLRHGPYPWHLKQRIASRLGHLGNHQSAEALDRMAGTALRAVIGLHLSAENNTADLARLSLRQAAPETVAVEAVTRADMVRVVLDGVSPIIERLVVPPPARRTCRG
jgi:phosphoribosyl 1,2-cyclic phosphodiesterase